MEKTLRIGEAAEQSGLATSAIRYYESLDILPKPERTTSGYRGYSSDDLDLLRFVARLRGLEFPLSDVREIVALRRDGKLLVMRLGPRSLGRLRQLRPGSRTCEDFRTNSGRWKKTAKDLPDNWPTVCICDVLEPAAASVSEVNL